MRFGGSRRRTLLILLALGAAISFAVPIFVLSMPRRADSLYVPTIYIPGGSCQMPLKLDDMTSINGLRRLEDIEVSIVAQTAAGPLRRERLSFEATRHDDSWGSIEVTAHQDAGRTMEYAYLSVTLPEGDEWRGQVATLTAATRLVYPAEVVTPEGQRSYENKSAPISRQFSFNIATREQERDAAERQARWEEEDRGWNSAYDRWATIRTVCFATGSAFVLALLPALLWRKRTAPPPE